MVQIPDSCQSCRMPPAQSAHRVRSKCVQSAHKVRSKYGHMYLIFVVNNASVVTFRGAHVVRALCAQSARNVRSTCAPRSLAHPIRVWGCLCWHVCAHKERCLCAQRALLVRTKNARCALLVICQHQVFVSTSSTTALCARLARTLGAGCALIVRALCGGVV